MSDQVRAIVMLATLGFGVLSVASLGCEAAFTRPLDRPSGWSAASLVMLGCAFAALTVSMWPLLAPSFVELWRLAWGASS